MGKADGAVRARPIVKIIAMVTSALHRPRHLRHRPRLRAPMRIRIAEIGPPVDNVRQTPITCWWTVVRAVVSALEVRRRRQQGSHRSRTRRSMCDICGICSNALQQLAREGALFKHAEKAAMPCND